MDCVGADVTVRHWIRVDCVGARAPFERFDQVQGHAHWRAVPLTDVTVINDMGESPLWTGASR